MRAVLAGAASRRVIAALTVLVLVAGVVAAVVHDDGSIPAGGARLAVDGVARVTHGGSERDVRGTATLGGGDAVEAREGTFTLTLADGTAIEGRARRGQAAATKLIVGVPVDVVAGEALVGANRPAAVTAAGNRIELQGSGSVTRISKGLSVRAETYRGTTLLDSAGQARTVPALRQVDVAVLGRPPATPSPLELDATDPWDLRYLGDAIDLTRTLDSFSRTLTASLAPQEGRTAGFYEQLLPDLSKQDGYGSALFGDRRDAPQGETLVGAAIAALGQRAGFADRWRAVFAFRAEGAAWGLVAADQGVASDPLTKALTSALNSAPLRFALGPGATPPTTAPPATTGPAGGTSSPTTTPPPTTTPTPTSPPPTTLPPVPPAPEVPGITLPTLPPPPSTPVPVLDDLLRTVGGLLNGVLGGGR